MLKYRTVVLEVLSRLPRRDRVSHSGVVDSADHAVAELSRPDREKQQLSATVKHEVVPRDDGRSSPAHNALHAQHAEEEWCWRPPDHAQHVKGVTGRGRGDRNPWKQGLAPAVKVRENNVKDDQSEANVPWPKHTGRWDKLKTMPGICDKWGTELLHKVISRQCLTS